MLRRLCFMLSAVVAHASCRYFQEQLAAHNLSLVMFILPGERKCQQTLPEFHAAATLIRRDLTLGAFLVDCRTEKFLCMTLCVAFDVRLCRPL